MRTRLLFLVLLVWAGPGQSASKAAQSNTTIHNVTLREHAGAGVMMTIAGTGFGRAPLVTVDGEPVAVLPGGTEMQIAVVAPAALLARPGTYRLTVVDPARHAGDMFVIASAAVAIRPARQPAGPEGTADSDQRPASRLKYDAVGWATLRRTSLRIHLRSLTPKFVGSSSQFGGWP